MKIYLLLAHPDGDSLNAAFADAYELAAREKGHELRRQNLGEIAFDPILWQGYKAVQELEPDLKLAQDYILWCERWVIFYPIWWGSVPALPRDSHPSLKNAVPPGLGVENPSQARGIHIPR